LDAFQDQIPHLGGVLHCDGAHIGSVFRLLT
jgi:hypothetical protein